MDWKFRTSVKEDIPAIEALFTEMLRTIYQNQTDETYPQGYLGKFYMGTGDWICVAEIGESVVGYLSIEKHGEDGGFLYLDDFSVTADHRSRGIGHKMIEAAIRYAVDENVGRIILHVEKENIGAQKLYRSFGFENLADEGDRIRMIKRI